MTAEPVLSWSVMAAAADLTVHSTVQLALASHLVWLADLTLT